jgi:parallel beta-helix repeat protein
VLFRRVCLLTATLVAVVAAPSAAPAPSTATARPCEGAAPPRARVVVVAPSSNLAAAASRAAPGTVFCLRAGVHRLAAPVVPQSGQQFLGEAGAVVSGARVLRSFVQEGRLWFADGQTQRNAVLAGECAGGGEACRHAEDVFLDGQPLRRVLSVGEVRRGAFFFDYDRSRIYLADPPAGRTVEAAVVTRAFAGWGTGARAVAIRNLVVEKFANEAGTGAIQALEDWRVEGNVVRLNHGIGIQGGNPVRGNRVLENGQLGLSSYGDQGTVVSGNEIAFNNYAGFDPRWEAGGAKWIRTTGLTVRDNRVHHNRGPGLWTDWDNRSTSYANNVVERNLGPGIFHEASYDAVIRNNVLRRNGFGFRGSLDGSGILVNSSSNVRIENNRLDRNLQGIGLVQADRGSGPFGPRVIANVIVRENAIVILPRGATGLVVVGGDASVYSAGGNRFERNRYWLCAPAYFAWAGGYVQKDGWLGAGHDVDGAFVAESRCR